ncbi:keratin, type I cytoskeletal 18-like [Pristis pectinata]|uniref:keratin, type I cytoskeletal 18-like n=1 Tax=Pristis pectinata TaxID=685728 RepID=UPI00223E4458|nr:keratin, type I cytoskeletal 18-like [Pristis pectinata]
MSNIRRSGYSFSSTSSIGGGSGRLVGKSLQRPTFTSLSMQSYGSRPQASISSLSYRRGISGLGSAAGIGSGLSSSSFSIVSGGGVINNEKNTMQNLNDRLSKYLEKVRSLEVSNKELEMQIREFSSAKTIEGFDWSVYNSTVRPLQQKIVNAIMDNARIALETDNAKLAAEDFRNKWQTELMLRQSVENDIDGLHQLKDTYLQLQGNLNSEISGLEDEISFLKKNHDEELKMLRQQKTQEVQVEVDSAPTPDLNAVLAELREKYTVLADQNQAEMDKWYKEQLSIKEVEIAQNDQAISGAKAELSQYRHQLQGLEAEYNGLLGNVNALNNTLDETEASYARDLQNLQLRIRQLEGELASVRNELVRHNNEYDRLLNIKMKLEAEINQYKVLLAGGNQSLTSGSSSSKVSQSYSSTSPASSVSTTKVVTERVTTRY